MSHKKLTFSLFIASLSMVLIYQLFSGVGYSSDIDKEWNNTQWKEKASLMIESQIISRGIKDKRVIEVMKNTPRHLFVPKELEKHAYDDWPLPISEGQTISQPYIVALMTELLKLKGNEKVLEIGTGSGYQAAVISKLAKECYSVEIIKSLAEGAEKKLKELGYKNVFVPEELIKQLKTSGKMVVPVGEYNQELLLITKEKDGIKQEKIIPVRFVPMVGSKKMMNDE